MDKASLATSPSIMIQRQFQTELDHGHSKSRCARKGSAASYQRLASIDTGRINRKKVSNWGTSSEDIGQPTAADQPTICEGISRK